jgi:signal transduction histidine kinase
VDIIERWRSRLRADPRFAAALSVVAAVVYYWVVVAGEIGRTGSIIVTAVPAALVLIAFRVRPVLAMGLSALGILAVAWGMTNGLYIQDVTQQSAAAVAIFGAARSTDDRVRRIGVAFTGFVAVAATLFVASRWYWGAGAGPVLVLPFLALTIGPWVLARAMRDLRVVSGQLETSQERNLLAERDVIIEQERNRVARDVHDVVAHSLAVVIAQADGARYAAEKDPTTVGPALDAIAETARVSLGEVRTLLHELRHTQSATPAPGSGDVDALVDGFRGLGLTVEVSHFGHQRALGEATQLALYRVLQESLTNALRHGDVTQPVDVDFDWGDHALAIVITSALLDDGVPQIDGPGHGIPGMRERAALAGGDVTVGIGTRGMFRVRASLPAGPAPDAPTIALTRA